MLKDYKKIDILVNCAGVNMPNKVITKDGFELHWAVNYFAPYLLTNLLVKPLKKAKQACIVNLVTNLAFVEKIDFNKIESKQDFVTNEPYTESKLSLSMNSIELAEQLRSDGVSINYLHPGNIKSSLLRHLKGIEKMMANIMIRMASPTEVGADRVVRLAISSAFAGITGAYLAENTIKPPHKEALIESKRKHIEQITRKALAKWL
ncbi:MAG: SDR family NAD(P)-dependent oxidoreductase [Flammeovirgaceae bacterium]|nr:SDR family NAD(P)-dependent oxidoreductase [Flammeovirgaceae bacterium]